MEAERFAKKLEELAIDDELLEKMNETERLVILFLREKLQQSDATEPATTKKVSRDEKSN